MKRVILVLIGLILLVGCASGDGAKLKKENLKLQEENLALREENVKLKEQIQELQAKYKLKDLKTNLGALRSAIAIYYGANMGTWPPSLEELFPEYIDSISKGDWKYDPKTGKVISKSHPSW